MPRTGFVSPRVASRALTSRSPLGKVPVQHVELTFHFHCVAIDWNPTTPEADEILHKRGITVLWPSSASQTAMGGHCSVNGTPTRKPSVQTLPPEIERRDRDR